MEITISISEELLESMYKKYCNERECVNCGCQQVIGDGYDGCFPRYTGTQFKVDIQEAFDLFSENIESTLSNE